MPNFNEVTRKEEIVLINIEKNIGLFKGIALKTKGLEKATCIEVVSLLETSIAELKKVAEESIHKRRDVLRVLNRLQYQFVGMDHESDYTEEKDIYQHVIVALEYIIEDYKNTKKDFPKVWGIEVKTI